MIKACLMILGVLLLTGCIQQGSSIINNEDSESILTLTNNSTNESSLVKYPSCEGLRKTYRTGSFGSIMYAITPYDECIQNIAIQENNISICLDSVYKSYCLDHFLIESESLDDCSMFDYIREDLNNLARIECPDHDCFDLLFGQWTKESCLNKASDKKPILCLGHDSETLTLNCFENLRNRGAISKYNCSDSYNYENDINFLDYACILKSMGINPNDFTLNDSQFLCNIVGGEELSNDNDKCLTTMAFFFENKSICLLTDSLIGNCLGWYAIGINSFDKEYCDNIGWQWVYCYDSIAYVNNDTNICLELPNINKEDCLDRIYKRTLNSNICLLKNENKASCASYILNVLESHDLSKTKADYINCKIAKDLGVETDRCFYNIALRDNNSSYCEGISESSPLREQCIDLINH